MKDTQGRLDTWLVSQAMVSTRSRAQALILAGKVQVNGSTERKSGRMVGPLDCVTLLEGLPYVSRGGLKLSHAFKVFGISPRGWTVIDVGASTGGFTDCWLQNGAAQVIAVDVGYGQLDWKLRNDPRVVVLERTNARYLTLEGIKRKDPVQGASIDASFIGLKLLLAPLCQMVEAGGVVMALIKPQFEAGPGKIGKGGVVRDSAVHLEVLRRIVGEIRELGYSIKGIEPSPIRGPEGNIEFLAHLVLEHGGDTGMIDLHHIVDRAWQMGDTDG